MTSEHTRWAYSVVVFAAAFLTGCGNMTIEQRGHPFSYRNVEQIKIGSTTQEEIVRLFGYPVQSKSKTGLVQYNYCYSPKQRVSSIGIQGTEIDGFRDTDCLEIRFTPAGIVDSQTIEHYHDHVQKAELYGSDPFEKKAPTRLRTW